MSIELTEKVTSCGIDLGTTNSAVGIVKNGAVELSYDKTGKKLIPSYIAYPPNARPPLLIGSTARHRLTTRPEGVIYDCKRLIGVNYNDEVVEKMKKYASFDIVDDGNNKPLVSVEQNGKVITKSPEEVGACILEYLKEQIREYAGNPDLNDVVITVPAYFNQKQRQATKDAGIIAGLNVLEIISEPVAAAYAYADQNNIGTDGKEKTILIYDLGGGTFDVTIMTVKDNNYREIGLDGDLFLGGSDFDVIIMEEVIKAYHEENEENEELTPRQKGKLRAMCEEAKIELKSTYEVEIEVNDDFTHTLSRQTMENLLQPYIQKTIDICDRLITKCNKTIQDIDDIVLVGGSTRLNIVHDMLINHFGKMPRVDINPDECVAYGAAKYAYSITHGINPVIYDKKTMHTISVGVDKGKSYPIIPSLTALPVKSYIKLSNRKPNLSSIQVHVYEGDHKHCRNNMKLTTLTLDGVQPMPIGQSYFRLDYEMTQEMRLLLCLTDLSTNHCVQWDSNTLGFDEVDMQELSANHNREQCEWKEYKNRMAIMNNIESKINNLLGTTQNEEIRSQLQSLYNQCHQSSTISELNEISQQVDNLFRQH